MNEKVIIYPTEKGWIKIRQILLDRATKFNFKEYDVDQDLKNKRTEDGGYEDQLWVIIKDLHNLFFNGQDYIEIDIKWN